MVGAERDGLPDELIDVTLPGDPAPQVGRLRLITQTRREIEAPIHPARLMTQVLQAVLARGAGKSR